MIPVILESPYSGNLEQNLRYARSCMLDSINHGEAPFLSHLLYTQIFDDSIPHERDFGMNAGFVWLRLAARSVVYTNLGISTGMECGIQKAREYGIEIIYRRLSTDLMSALDINLAADNLPLNGNHC